MKWGLLMGITAIVVFIILFEWPKINHFNEKVTFIILTSFGFGLAVMLVFFPDTPGPTQMISFIFKPFGKLLKK